MSSADSNRFSAAGSALSYLAQVEHALLDALRQIDADVELGLPIETIDDIIFDMEGQPRELWRTKHHVDRRGSLGDASVDIWKTLHNWIETSSVGAAFFLLTTAHATTDSAVSLEGSTRSQKDLLAARMTLDVNARAAGSQSSPPWETGASCASDPTHMIHLNGDKFLRPHAVEAS